MVTESDGEVTGTKNFLSDATSCTAEAALVNSHELCGRCLLLGLKEKRFSKSTVILAN